MSNQPRTEEMMSFTTKGLMTLMGSMISSFNAFLPSGRKVDYNSETMPNGEVRIRIIFSPEGQDHGFSAILTVAGPGGWQNAHFHTSLTEYYLVLRGKMTIMTEDGDLTEIGPGGTVMFTPGFHHNVKLDLGTVILTIKASSNFDPKDWHKSEALQTVTDLLK
ncbi:MAG: cupin domain-containing protein [Candidatus Magasanikbacteria bacterium]